VCLHVQSACFARCACVYVHVFVRDQAHPGGSSRLKSAFLGWSKRTFPAALEVTQARGVKSTHVQAQQRPLRQWAFMPGLLFAPSASHAISQPCRQPAPTPGVLHTLPRVQCLLYPSLALATP